MQKTGWSITFCFLTLLIILAVCSFASQAGKGLTVTGLNEPVVWGAYVVNFTFCLGLAAGILIVLTILIDSNVISATEKFLLSVTGLVSLFMVGAFIILDIGRPDRFYYMIIYPQLKSPLFWDFVMVNFFMVVTIVYCFVTLRQIYLNIKSSSNLSFFEKIIYKVVTIKKDCTVNKSVKKVVRVFLLLLITGAYFITTEVFTGLKARPGWHSPIVNVIFFLSALLCGLSALVLVKSFCQKSSSFQNSTIFHSEQNFLTILLVADLAAILVKFYMDRNNPLIRETGSLLPFSLFVFLILGNVLPVLLILFCKQKRLGLYRLVPILVLAGVLLKRAELVIPAYFARWLPFASDASYYPTLPEISIVLGVYSAAIIALLITFRFVQSTDRVSNTLSSL